jgi:hypothetical protein
MELGAAGVVVAEARGFRIDASASFDDAELCLLEIIRYRVVLTKRSFMNGAWGR